MDGLIRGNIADEDRQTQYINTAKNNTKEPSNRMQRFKNWVKTHKEFTAFVILLAVAIILYVICVIYSSVVDITVWGNEGYGPVYHGISAHLRSKHYHLVKVLLPMSVASAIASVVFLILATVKYIKRKKKEVNL